MTIGKDILTMTQDDLLVFVQERRKRRTSKIWASRKRKPADQSIAKLAKDLGLAKHEVAKRIKAALED